MLDDFDSILYLDADTVVLSSIHHMFDIPAELAMTRVHNEINVTHGCKNTTILNTNEMIETCEYHNRIEPFYIDSGVLLLHPCVPVHNHMMELIDAYHPLQFNGSTAEALFLLW
jgi:lipopolysaccharide biosynthesis glycosyltransferase